MINPSPALTNDESAYKPSNRHKDKNEHVQVIRRKDIPSLHSVSINDKTHYLGVLKDFHKHPVLNNFVPKHGRLSVSWVHLGKNEMLEPHVHPIKSMIIICRGQTKTLGELSTTLHEGDILIVPPHREHGFIGSGDEGFWGLSVQFEKRGLYENPSVPLAQFIDRPKIIKKIQNDNECSNLSSLLKINKMQKKNLKQNPLFGFLKAQVQHNISLRDLFLSYFQVWSDAFQKMVLTREALCENPSFKEISEKHLEDEFGHNRQLSKERKNKHPNWDPILHATANWFPWKMLSLDETEKVVIVHLVIEAAATVFYTEVPSFVGRSINSSHFAAHETLDVDHERMGIFLLEGLAPAQYDRLHHVQQEGWDMINQLFKRIYELIHTQADYDL
jgi:quercetin dioxygenase-like cupin family protein